MNNQPTNLTDQRTNEVTSAMAATLNLDHQGVCSINTQHISSVKFPTSQKFNEFYSTQVSSLFNSFPQHSVAFLLPWHEFENSVAVEIWLWHSRRFTNCSFCFHVIVESVTSQTLLLWPVAASSSAAFFQKEGAWLYSSHSLGSLTCSPFLVSANRPHSASHTSLNVSCK
jgi:hypothetical protein